MEVFPHTFQLVSWGKSKKKPLIQVPFITVKPRGVEWCPQSVVSSSLQALGRGRGSQLDHDSSDTRGSARSPGQHGPVVSQGRDSAGCASPQSKWQPVNGDCRCVCVSCRENKRLLSDPRWVARATVRVVLPGGCSGCLLPPTPLFKLSPVCLGYYTYAWT